MLFLEGKELNTKNEVYICLLVNINVNVFTLFSFIYFYSHFLFELLANPSHPLDEAVSRGRAGRLDVPCDVPQLLQLEPLCDLVLVVGLREVALVCEDKHHHVLHVGVRHDLEQLLPRVLDSLVVGAVNNVDQRLCPRVVVPPQRTELLLAANIL